MFAFFAGLFLVCGCAARKIAPHPLVTVPGISRHFTISQIVDLNHGEVLSFEKFIEQIAAKDLIFLGEVHDNPEHHLIQVQILQALVDCCGPLAVAMECFQASDQTEVDRYLKAEITEEEFLRGVDWAESWGYDYDLYRPLLLLAKGHGIPVLAINAPQEIVRRVAREGLANLNPDERSRLPKHIDLQNEAHRAYVRKAYKQKAHRELPDFEYFYEAQCVWEETMAHNIAAYVKDHEGKVVGLAGNGHIVNKFGIPLRTIRRVPVSMVTIILHELEGATAVDKETADYVWFTSKCDRRPRSMIKQGQGLLHMAEPPQSRKALAGKDWKDGGYSGSAVLRVPRSGTLHEIAQRFHRGVPDAL
ncbi:MAG: ChaN family lipoprotein [Deltaproteobacteria bacterium]